jgi:carboxymethylenebutenolidase
VGQLRALGARVDYYRYPGTSHWFFEPSWPQYQPEAARTAWERTLAFLNSSLRG